MNAADWCKGALTMIHIKGEESRKRPKKKANLKGDVVLVRKYTAIDLRELNRVAVKEKSVSSRPFIPFKKTGAQVAGEPPQKDKARKFAAPSFSLPSLPRVPLVNFFRNYYIHIGAGILLVMVVFGVFFTRYLLGEFEKVKAIADFRPNVITKIYDRNGLLISELFKQKREVLSYEELENSPYLVKAFIAMEDNDFYEHFGINPKGIARAFFINLAAGRVKQGGSTITQQVSKILLTDRERNLARKIKEAFIALMMDASYSKEEILSLYLNQIYLGHGAYGVEAAANLYFNKSARELNLAECALLAALPGAPNRFSPIRHPKRSMSLHKTALARMVDLGFVTTAEANEAYKKFWPEYLEYINELSPTYNTWSLRVDEAPWITEYVRRRIIDTYGEEVVYNEGLVVYTTFDLKKQRIAAKMMRERLEHQTIVSGRKLFKNEDYFTEHFGDDVELFSLFFDLNRFTRIGSYESKKFNDHLQKEILDSMEIANFLGGTAQVSNLFSGYRSANETNRFLLPVEGALVSLDQDSGGILAMVGGSEFSSINQLNRVLQSKRQPGSSIKPLLYAAAIETEQFTPATAVLDAPVVYLYGDGDMWSPENYEGEYFGEVLLRRALAKSINVISIRIAEEIGIGTFIDYLGKFLHLTKEEAADRIPRNLSIALGSVECSPMEMARSYAIIANGGKEVIPYAIKRVEDRDGNVLEDEEKKIQDELARLKKEKKLQIIKPATAQVMISMLRTVIDAGTGVYANPGRPAGGKTGTTNNWRDAWFVGFTPEMTTCMWIGYDKLGMTLGRGQTGGMVCAPVWGAYVKEALADDPVKEFPVYANLETAVVTRSGGLLPGPGCNDVIQEIFVPGTVPTEKDSSCSTSGSASVLNKPEPTKNIVAGQKVQIEQEIKSSGGGAPVLEDIGDDLLD